jgi:hypothetical protein
MIIKKIHLANLRNDAHFQYLTEFRDLIVKCNAQTLKIKPLFDAFTPLYARLDEALKKIVKSPITEKLNEADKARDEVFAGMVEIISGMCKHFTPAVRDAAKRVKVITGTYGNVARKPLNEQTSALYNLIQDLRTDKITPDTEALSIAEWINELAVRNDAFEKLTKERFEEAAEKTHIILRETRNEIDAVYHKIIKRIEALVEVEGEEDYEPFVNTLNEVVAKYNVHRHQHHGHRAPAAEGDAVGD